MDMSEGICESSVLTASIFFVSESNESKTLLRVSFFV